MTLPKNNISDNTNISFVQNTKANLISLFKQTIQVFIGFIFMLLLTEGNPPVFIISLSVIVGIIFVALSQIKRVDRISIKASIFQLLKDFFYAFKPDKKSAKNNNHPTVSNYSKILIITTKTIKVSDCVYSISSIICLSISTVSPTYSISIQYLVTVPVIIYFLLLYINILNILVSMFLVLIEYWGIMERIRKQAEYVLHIEFSNGKTEVIYSKNKAFLELIQNKIYIAMNHQSSTEKYMFNLQEETIISQ
ncbi:MAG: hypothetical protein QNJ42_14520 [Crocosphaera sp.]|nr:hypothetical protein [Crocosphaera sp.]